MRLLMLVSLCVVGSNTWGQENVENKRQLAEKIMELTNSKAMLQQITDSVFLSMSQQMPDLAKHKGTFSELVKSGSEDFIREIVDLYVETFSEQELQDLAGFLESSSGQSFIQKMPLLTQKSMQIGQAWGLKISEKMLAEIEQ